MPGERLLLSKLRINGRKPGQGSSGWLYDSAKFLFKLNAPDNHTTEYDDFSRQVITATLAIGKNPAGAKIIEAFKQISFTVDILPTTGGGYFVPFCEDAAGSYELPSNRDTGAIIVWDPTAPFTHNNTADGTAETLPPWVILAHEMGHAIQLSESAGTKNSWLTNYSNNMEAVEIDNINRHETPIVVSLGKKPRVRYQ